jgi:hypothetical protein
MEGAAFHTAGKKMAQLQQRAILISKILVRCQRLAIELYEHIDLREKRHP